MTDADRFRVPLEDLRRQQDPAVFQFECTEDLAPLTELIGQDRALRALQFGLGVDKQGYNVFVTGLTGTGKTSAVLEYVKRAVADRRAASEVGPPDDWCYVYNFKDPDRPNAVRLPAGRGRQFRDQLADLLELIRANMGRAFSSEDYERRRRAILDEGQGNANLLMERAQADAVSAGFLLTFAPTGVSLVPMRGDKPMTPEEFSNLSPEERAGIQEKEGPVAAQVAEVGRKLRAIEREVSQQLRQLDRVVAQVVAAGSFDALVNDYHDVPDLPDFLRNLQEFTSENVALLRESDASSIIPLPVGATGQPDPLIAYRVNVFIDNSGADAPPIVVEPNPNWSNLFGRIERRAFLGTYISDHTMLRPGSVHRANGGYLILNFIDLVSRPGAWDGLKRLIRTREARLEDPLEQYGMLTPQALRPEPIPMDIKVLITGDPVAYFILTAYDEEFWELFKVRADFDYQIPRNAENALAYAGFICATCIRDGLRHFDRSAVARVVEHGSRLVDDQEKLSSRFGRLRDVLVEADYWAAQDRSDLVRDVHVERAISERVYRLNLVEERIREMIARGTLIVDVDQAVVGQVNGLAVLDFREYSFARPSRITARTYLGQRGVVSIDRESQLSGKTHDKGVLTLSGYVGWKYAQDKPLSLSATVSFEQGYDTVEGDSASLSELCAILSALADAPIRQDLAVTGSVNQKGDVQPIGGVNEKIEGFHDICRAVGFTGKQGVVIPARNRMNLMLRGDVLDSVRRGDFRVLEINTVDEAIEALTGIPAGERGPDGAYPKDSVHGRVNKRLSEMSEAMRQFGRRDGARPDEPEEQPSPTAAQPEDDPTTHPD